MVWVWVTAVHQRNALWLGRDFVAETEANVRRLSMLRVQDPVGSEGVPHYGYYGTFLKVYIGSESRHQKSLETLTFEKTLEKLSRFYG